LGKTAYGLVVFILLSVLAYPYLTFTIHREERGTFSIYFMDEKVGYEEYSWQEGENGFILSVKGRMTKPMQLEIERLAIHLDKSFVPIRFQFKGSLNGITQEVASSISEGHVENVIRVAGQEQKSTVKVRRDTFLLPNPIFSSYMAITKKFHCSLKESVALSAYIIPQMETQFTLEPKEEEPCTLIMQMSSAQIQLETDEQGRLTSLQIPSQKIRITRTR
jgi:hypothetical protein